MTTPYWTSNCGRPLRVLSLGAGVQSSVVLLLSCKGVLPKLDHAIFADTQWEPRAVYEHLTWLEGEAAKAGVPIHRVTAGSVKAHAIVGKPKRDGGSHYLNIPLFILNARGDGGKGIVRKRQCTRDYKLRPIEQKVRQLLGLKRGQHWPRDAVVQQWIGISADEANRVRADHRAAVRNYYPLVYDLGMTREDCIEWAAQHYRGREFPRSACIGCPYHQNDEWAKIKANPDEWADACAADEAIRNRDGRRGTAYLHHSLVPLAEADLTVSAPRRNNPRLFRAECLGMCGV
jgi:hypothetical protein